MEALGKWSDSAGGTLITELGQSEVRGAGEKAESDVRA